MANTKIKSHKIYIEPSIIGCKLSLDVSKSKTVSNWAVEDAFNGKSHVVPITESIYGFYEKDGIVDLYLYDTKNKETIIKNVTLLEREEVTLNV